MTRAQCLLVRCTIWMVLDHYFGFWWMVAIAITWGLLPSARETRQMWRDAQPCSWCTGTKGHHDARCRIRVRG